LSALDRPQKPGLTPNRLDSWKDIAAFMNRSVRCVQMWERDEGLPVHRIEHDKRGSVYAFPAELEEWLQARNPRIEPSQPSPTDRKRNPRRKRTVVAALLCFALVTGSYFTWRGVSRAHAPESAEPVPLTTFAGVELSPSLSPDGSHVAFAWNGEDRQNWDVYATVIGGGRAVRLTTNPASDTSPSWSPDGRFICFFRSSSRPAHGVADVIIMSALGGSERKIAEIDATNRYWARPVWTRDSQYVIVPDRAAPNMPHALFAVSRESGDRRRITAPPPASDGDSSSALSPDGRTLAFVRNRSLSVGDIFLQRLSPDMTAVGEPRLAGGKRDFYFELSWASNGAEIIYLTSSGLWRLPISGRANPRVVVKGGGIRQFSISPAAGRLVYSQTVWDPDIWRLDLATPGTPEKFAHSTRAEYLPAISPDGRKVAFQSDRGGSHEIWVSNSDGSEPVQLTTLKAFSGHPRWSPDSDSIAFDSTADGKFGVWVVPSAGGQPRRLFNDHSQQTMPNWSRDGKWIYYGSDRTGNYQVWKAALAGGDPVQITRNGGYAAIESTDRSTIFYATLHTSAAIWKALAQGGAEELVIARIFGADSFQVVDDGIYYVSFGHRDGASGIRFHRFASGKSEWVRQLAPMFQAGLAISPDRRWLLYSTWDYSAGDLMLLDNFR
jgi:Tol biopolymer transport system component